MRLDHLVVSAATLQDGVDHVETALGVGLAAGGVHAHMGTHNRLLNLGDLYLEVIAIDPDAAPPPWPRWFDLDNLAGAPRLTNWVVATADLDAEVARGPAGLGVATALSRGDLRWRMAIPATGVLPLGDAFPALIEWQGAAHPTRQLGGSDMRLRELVVVTPFADELEAALRGAARGSAAADRKGGGKGDAGRVFGAGRDEAAVTLRLATPQDAAAVAAIWNHYIRETTVTFNPVEKTVAEAAAAIASRPVFFVVETGGGVQGFSTYDQFRPGPGNTRSMEHSILLAPEAGGRGLGRLLLTAVEDHARGRGAGSIWAGVSGENGAGRAFHARMGYAEVAVLPAVGWKFGRYLDLVMMQKFLS